MSEEQGFTQILVLSGLMAISALVTTMLVTSLQTTGIATVLERSITGGIARRSAAVRMFSAIENPADTLARQALQHPVVLQIGGEKTGVEIRGDAGRLDPLTAPLPVVEGYAADLGLSGSELIHLRDELTAARRSQNWEAAHDAILRYLLPSASSAELDADFGSHLGLASIDPTTASARVLRALPDLADAAVEAIVAERTAGEPLTVNSAYFRPASSNFSLHVTVEPRLNQRSGWWVPFTITSSGRAQPSYNPY